jgi:hypothetical protein
MGNLLSKTPETVAHSTTCSEVNPEIQNYRPEQCLDHEEDDVVLIDIQDNKPQDNTIQNIKEDIKENVMEPVKEEPVEKPIEEVKEEEPKWEEPIREDKEVKPEFASENPFDVLERISNSFILPPPPSPPISIDNRRKNRRRRRVRKIHQTYNGIPNWAVTEYMKKKN